MISTRATLVLGLIFGSWASVAMVAHADPTKITACTTIVDPGSYVLDTNLAGTTAGCIVITADFVTLDLNGFAITGEGNAGAGIRLDLSRTNSPNGIVIRNGTVANFGNGVGFQGVGNDVQIERMRFFGNGSGVSLTTRTIVRDSIFSGNFFGLRVGPRSQVTGNLVTNNSLGGMQVGAGSVVTGNTVARNRGEGVTIGIDAGAGSTLIGNAAIENGNVGIETGAGSTIVNNTSRGHSSLGFSVQCPSTISANAATDNAFQNIHTIGGGCVSSHNTAP